MFQVGDSVYSLNPKYKDGTRLRSLPEDDPCFNGVWLPNDICVLIIDLQGEYARVRKNDGDSGWIRLRNLSKSSRVQGITKGVIANEIVTPDPEYVMGMKIYGVGIKEDPIPGQKFGKGIQHLISTYWMMAMSEFIAAHLEEMQSCLSFAQKASEKHPGYDYLYFTNLANYLFNRSEVSGLKSQDSIDFFLMATWLVMAAAEVDDFPFRKYSIEERKTQRIAFYNHYLNNEYNKSSDIGRDDAASVGKFLCSPSTRSDMLPPIAMERLGINNELSALKYRDPEQPLREGFMISKRIDSLKRHMESVHRKDTSEDHIIHLLWNAMAIYHVNIVFPKKNDLIDFESIRNGNSEPQGPKLQAYSPTTSLEKINNIIPSMGPIPGSILKLDWNEGVIPPPKTVRDAIIMFINAAEGDYLKWYPQLGGGNQLKNEICQYCGVIPENVMITNGSDDALILICHTYLGPGKTVIAPVPTYEHFCVNAEGSHAKLIRFQPKNPMETNDEEIALSIEQNHPQLVYLVSPNNPLGTIWNEHSVRNLAKRYPNTVFIVDEAYYEFSNSTCIPVAVELQNVIVTRTFSKAFCLASLRCGYIVTHPNTIESLRVLYNPKSVNQVAQVACTAALKEYKNYYLPYIEATNSARLAFIQALNEKGIQTLNGGGGNFVCIHIKPESRVKEVIKSLEENTIYVRDISAKNPGIIRVSIGPEMKRVTDLLISLLTK